MRTVLGLDAGGTSTRALLVDESGRCLATGRSGPGNPTSAGEEMALRHLVEAAGQALAAAPPGVPPTAAVVTAAGNITGGMVEGFAAATGVAVGSVLFVGDILGAWFSATAVADGAVVVAGTGTTAARVEGGAMVRCADGLGWLVGAGGPAGSSPIAPNSRPVNAVGGP